MQKKYLQLLKQHGRAFLSAAFAVLYRSKNGTKINNQDVMTAGLQAFVMRLVILLAYFRQYSKTLLLMLMFSHITLAVTPPGTILSNTATASFTVSGVNFTLNSNNADLVSTIIGTDAVIEQYAYVGGTGTLNDETPTSCFDDSVAPGSFTLSPIRVT